MDNVTPSRVMYNDLKSFGGIKLGSAADILLSDRPRAGGRSLRERAAATASFLTREVCDAEPGRYGERDFSDFSTAALTLTGRMVDRLGGTDAHERICRHYREEAVRQMCDALDAYGRKGTLYANAVERVATMTLANEKDRASVLVLLFVATGCLDQPYRAFRLADDFARAKLSGYFHTKTDADGPAPVPAAPRETSMALVRERNGVGDSRFYQLDPSGTEIGAFSDGPSDISEVELDVSAPHLRIWREDGRWYCEGLGSTNGTTIVSTDGRVSVVEPPKRERARDWRPEPHELFSADLICLGAHTCFRVFGGSIG